MTTLPKPWTIEQFFEWQARQDDRYELVGGVPVRLDRARNVHDLIVVNLLSELRRQLRGSGCRPFTGDGSVETRPGQIRRPDAGVDCGRWNPDGMMAALPRMVAEVLSPTTRDFDTFEKLAEYKDLPTLDHILIIEPNAPEAVLWSRAPDRTWVRDIIEGIDREVAMPGLGVTLAMTEIYDGVEVPEGPRAVRRDEAAPGP